jgi:hypothetical protein
MSYTKQIVATGTWLYAGTIARKVEVFSVPAMYSSTRYDEDDHLVEARPIPQTADGSVYKTSCGGEEKSLEAIMKWADAQPWGPVKWDNKKLR